MDRLAKSRCCYVLLALMMATVKHCIAVTVNETVIMSRLDSLDAAVQQLSLRLQQLSASAQSQSPKKVPMPAVSSPYVMARDCADLRPSASTSGVYTIYVGVMQRPVQVYCDMVTDGGGWTIIQRRRDGSVNFYRNWNEYANGFGNPLGEHWLGNENIHWLTSNGNQYKLRFDLGDADGDTRYAEYDNFKVGNACSKYNLTSAGTYCGTAGDSFSHHVGMMFTTQDQDNDLYKGASGVNPNCAVAFHGAWWYNSCHKSNLNGYYYNGPYSSYGDGVDWDTWKGHQYSMSFSEMKLRPADV